MSVCQQEYYGFLLILLFSFLTFWSGPALAGPVPKDNGSISAIRPLPEDVFHSQTSLREVKLPGDQESALQGFSMRLPQGWSKMEKIDHFDSIDSGILGELARFYSPPQLDARSRFVVQAVRLDHDIRLDNWFRHYIFSRGFTMTSYEQVSDSRIDAIFVVVDGDITYIARTAAVSVNDYVALATYYIPDRHWESRKSMQASVVESFKVDVSGNLDLIKTLKHTFLDLVEFQYPKAWELQAPEISTLERMRATVINTYNKQNSNGWIDVYILSTLLDEPLSEDLRKMRKRFEESGFEIGKLIGKVDNYQFGPHVEASHVEKYEAFLKARKYFSVELWVSVIKTSDYVYVVSLITPSKDDDFYKWAVNTEAFEGITTSLKPFSDDDLYYYGP